MLIVKFHNDGTGTRKIGNYNYTVFMNHEQIAEGRVEDHRRSAGWEGLMMDLAEQLREDMIDKVVRKTVEEYGEVLERLGRGEATNLEKEFEKAAKNSKKAITQIDEKGKTE